jgi:hypothetical protein
MGKFLRLLLLAILAVTATCASAQPKERITLAQMESMFQNMRTKTPLAVDGELLWGYFFTDPQQAKLKPVADELAKAGYRVVDFHLSQDGRTHVLEVQKIERHTPQTLHQRNQELYRLSDKYGIQSYDGMDVGPVPQLK